MSNGATTALTQEIAAAGRGLIRLARHDPRWPDGFDVSTTGFFRSFFAPLLALPFALVAAALALSEGGMKTLSAATLWASGLSHLVSALAFPALVAIIARPFQLTVGYAAFIVLVNWTVLFTNLILCAAAPLTLLGKAGYGVFAFVLMMLMLTQLYLIWRAARETLSVDYAPALLMVVLSVAVGVAADQVGGLIAGLVT